MAVPASEDDFLARRRSVLADIHAAAQRRAAEGRALCAESAAEVLAQIRAEEAR